MATAPCPLLREWLAAGTTYKIGCQSSWWFAKQRLFDRTTMMRKVPLEMGDYVFFLRVMHAALN